LIWIVQNLWLIPALPIFAAGIAALLKQRSRVAAVSLAIGSMTLSFLIANRPPYTRGTP
jgi:NADH-quinone oxidoreductase subunit L